MSDFQNVTDSDYGPDIIIQNVTHFIVDEHEVSAENIITGLWVDAVVGFIFMFLFILLQAESVLYRFREFSSSVSYKPKPLARRKSRKYWDWIYSTLFTSDFELLRTAGLDALMMVKINTLAIQLFLPLTIIGCALLIPVHISGHGLDHAIGANKDKLMRLTLSNIEQGSRIVWLHYFLAVGYVAYAMWLLMIHYQQFVIIRQQYMRCGSDPSMWHDIYETLLDDGTTTEPPYDGSEPYSPRVGVANREGGQAGNMEGSSPRAGRDGYMSYGSSPRRTSGQSPRASRISMRAMSPDPLTFTPEHESLTSGFPVQHHHSGSISSHILGTSTTPSNVRLPLSTVHSDTEAPVIVTCSDSRLANNVPDVTRSSKRDQNGYEPGSGRVAQIQELPTSERMYPQSVEKAVGFYQWWTARPWSVNTTKPATRASLPDLGDDYAFLPGSTAARMRGRDSRTRMDSPEEGGAGAFVNSQQYVVLVTFAGQTLYGSVEPKTPSWIKRILTRIKEHLQKYPWLFRQLFISTAHRLRRVRNRSSLVEKKTPSTPVSGKRGRFRRMRRKGKYKRLDSKGEDQKGLQGGKGVRAVSVSSENGYTQIQLVPTESIPTTCPQHDTIDIESPSPLLPTSTTTTTTSRHHQSPSLSHTTNAHDLTHTLANSSTINDDEPLQGEDPDLLLNIHPQKPRSGRELWVVVQQHVREGSVAALLYDPEYSVVTATFKRLFKDEFYRVIPVFRHDSVDMLLVKMDRLQAKYEQAQAYEKATGRPLMRRPDPCSPPEDVAERLYQRIVALHEEIKRERKYALEHRSTQSYFVFFKTQRAATIAAQCSLLSEDNRQFRTEPAPGPEEVNWPTLWLNWKQKKMRNLFVTPLIFLVIMFPIGIFSGVVSQLNFLFCTKIVHTPPLIPAGQNSTFATNTTIPTLASEAHFGTVEWYCQDSSQTSHVMKQIVTGWLPGFFVSSWQNMVLPTLLYVLNQARGRCSTLSELDRHISGSIFLFDVLNIFVGGVAGSSVAQQINQELKGSFDSIFNSIGVALPSSSNFFISYMLIRAFIGIPMQFLTPHSGIRFFLLRRYLRCSCIMSERDKSLLYAPVSPRYGFDIGMLLLAFLIGVAFSVIAPITQPVVLVFFLISWLYWRYSLLYVFVRKYESGGLMWPLVFTRLMACLAIFAFFTSCTFVAKKAFLAAVMLLMTVGVMLWRFNRYCYRRFQAGLHSMPLELAQDAPEAMVDTQMYFPPPLHPRSKGWHPEWMKPWEGWNLPSYSF